MKRTFLSLLLLLPFAASAQMTVGATSTIGKAPVAVDIRLPKGILIPRMTYAQKYLMDADSSLTGLTVYQTDRKSGFYLWDGRAWMSLMPLNLNGGSGDSLSATDFATVAFSGDYNDLKNRPVIFSGSDGQPLVFAKVAVTGNYNDLVNLPVILTDIPALHKIAYSGDYNDLSGFPGIRTHLQEFESDMYYMLTDSATVKTWENAARQPVPTRIAELSEDYTHQSVTDKDIQRWDSASVRYIPTRLRELTQDSAHRTLTATQVSTYTEAANRIIPTTVSDLSTDYSHLIVTEQEAASWDASVTAVGFSGDYNDLTNKPVIPDSLCQIMSDDFYQTISAEDRSRWNAMTGRQSRPYLTDLEPDEGHQIPTTRQVDAWNAGASREYPQIATAARTGNYEDLPADYKYKIYSKELATTGRFEYINSLSSDYPIWAPVAVSGDYNDLNGRPDELYRDRKNIRYSDLADTPVYTRVAVTGRYNDLTDAAGYRKMSRYQESTTAVHISQQLHDSLQLMYNTLNSIVNRAGSHFGGTYRNLKLKENITLTGQPTVNANNYNPEDPNAIVTFSLAAEMDRKAKAAVDSIADALVPEGSVIFWYDVDGTGIPDCWEPLQNMAGRFPVGLGSGTFGTLSYTGGEERHIIAGMELPAHKHNIANRADTRSTGSQGNYVSGFGIPSHYNGISDVGVSPIGADQPHENRPPYFALYILKKSKAACAANK